jgi:hypothetical protein
MFGFFLMAVATLFDEASNSLGKSAVSRRLESVYSFGFLSIFWTCMIWILGVLILHIDFYFNPKSLPFFLPRLALEVVIAYFSVKAITIADRSTFAFLRLVTIPLLLAVDIVLGNGVTTRQILGTLIIFGAMALLLETHSMNKKGSQYVLVGALLAVITLSLFKYDITHYNSVAAEQIIVDLVLLSFFLTMSWRKSQENAIRYLARPLQETQSIAQGFGNVLSAFSIKYGSASLMLTANRSFALIWAIAFGNIYFHEKHIVLKIFAYFLVVVGLIVMLI